MDLGYRVVRAAVRAEPVRHSPACRGGAGLHHKTVYGWLKANRDGGRGALLARPAPGRPPRLGQLHMRRMWTRGMKRPRFKADDPTTKLHVKTSAFGRRDERGLRVLP